MPAIPNSPARREYHLNYEIWMLEETNKKRHVDEVIKNALIESFCVHARNLFEFFMEEAPQYTQNYRLDINRNCDCKRNIEMTPLCKIEETLPRVLGSREVRLGGVVDEQAGIQPS